MYQLTSGDTILRLSDGAFIPQAPGNRDYAEYKAWRKKGNTPQPAPPPPPAPAPRSPRQKLEALGLTVAELKRLVNESEETVMVRARNEDGTYIADNPATPRNEAYVEVPISEA